MGESENSPLPLDPPFWSFDVFTAHHDDIKDPEIRFVRAVWSRVLIDREQVPDWRHAYADAACMAVAIHGGMPTAVLPRY